MLTAEPFPCKEYRRDRGFMPSLSGLNRILSSLTQGFVPPVLRGGLHPGLNTCRSPLRGGLRSPSALRGDDMCEAQDVSPGLVGILRIESGRTA
jgi:hypothetical protein